MTSRRVRTIPGAGPEQADLEAAVALRVCRIGIQSAHPLGIVYCLPELRTPVALLGRSAEYHEGHRAFQRLLTMAEPILADGPGS